MLDVASGLDLVRDIADEPKTAELTRVLLNATSSAEAALALRMLEDSASSKQLVAACNLREVIAALPATPCTSSVDADTLQRIGGFERRPLGVLARELTSNIELCVLTAGNLVLDVVFRTTDETVYWSPVPRECEFITAKALDIFIGRDEILAAMLQLARDMGVVFNPPFYVSLEDFRLEHARDAIAGIDDLF
ncbi:MAG: hypothetical protein HY876_10225 [Coriobacteriales bacterium]|nr:hypothetical protein [Coriobacteriales bacterium]